MIKPHPWLKFYKSLSLRELRRRQRLTNAQLKLAHDYKKLDATKRLRLVERLLTQAVLETEFDD